MFRVSICILLLIACNNPIPETIAIKGDSAKKKNIVIANKAPLADTEVININIKPVTQKPVQIKLINGDSFTLFIPKDYNISIAAEGLKRLRFLFKGPDGRLFATDMYDKNDNHKGRVLIFDQWNDSAKKFESTVPFLEGLHNPNQAAFYKGYLYVAETDRLTRYTYNNGKNAPADTGHTIIQFPAYGLSYKYGGWHLTRSLTFHNDKLYVSVGSSCNACLETEEIRASVLEMNPDGTEVKYFARGLRNSVGLKWIGNNLWSTNMGRDLIGPDKPEDLFQKIDKGGYYGWPFYFQYKQKIYADEQFKDSVKPVWISKPPIAFAGFKAHSAPLGFDYFKGFDDDNLKNCVLVCLHGSTSVWRQRGNSIVRVEGGNKYSEIISGFLTGKKETDRHGRPCDILMNDNHSFFFTDDLNGVLYYVWK